MKPQAIQLLIGFVVVPFFGSTSPLFAQSQPAPAPSAERVDPDQKQSNLLRLNQMSPEELVELRRKKRQFDELSDQQKKQVTRLYSQLQSNANQAELNSVMQRYYAWLRNLERDERNSLLDLPAEERLKKIKTLHEERARKLFGTTGATKLPSQDVQPFIEWINELRQNKQAEITEHFDSVEGRQILQQWRERQRRSGRRIRRSGGRSNSRRGNQPVNTEQRDNVRFNIFMEAHPEFMAELIYQEIDGLLAKLSQEALQILEEQNAEEQKLLVYNWAAEWARQISATRGVLSDDELQRFYETLSDEDKETLDSYSPTGWRRRLEELYRRQQRQRGFVPPRDLPEENRAAVGQSVPD